MKPLIKLLDGEQLLTKRLNQKLPRAVVKYQDLNWVIISDFGFSTKIGKTVRESISYIVKLPRDDAIFKLAFDSDDITPEITAIISVSPDSLHGNRVSHDKGKISRHNIQQFDSGHRGYIEKGYFN